MPYNSYIYAVRKNTCTPRQQMYPFTFRLLLFFPSFCLGRSVPFVWCKSTYTLWRFASSFGSVRLFTQTLCLSDKCVYTVLLHKYMLYAVIIIIFAPDFRFIHPFAVDFVCLHAHARARPPEHRHIPKACTATQADRQQRMTRIVANRR